MKFILLLLLSIILALLPFVQSGPYRISKPGTGFFEYEPSPNGDTNLFHGVNIVHKGPGLRDLGQKDIDLIKSMGFNCVRFGILWTNIQPTSVSSFNYSYLLAAKSQVDFLWQNGINVFLDMHQDCFSARFKCGDPYDGVPLWASSPPNESEYFESGSKAFPLPLQKPNFVKPTDPNYNPAYGPWGQPSASVKGEGCSFSGWAECYPTYALGAAVQNFYHNVDGMADNFAKMWAEVARVFKGHPAVIGLELINEPWLGDWGKYPELWLGSFADDFNLSPFYDRVAAAIRKVDADTPIFFEPATGGAFLEGDIGFKNGGPGGEVYSATGKNVLSWHAYCPIIQSDGVHFNKSGAILNFIRKEVCEVFQNLDMQSRAQQVSVRKFGGFLSEFGAIPSTKIAADYMESMMVELDKIQHSFTFWEIDLLEGAPQYIRNSLIRSYPKRVPGTVIQYKTTNYTGIPSNGHNASIVFELDYTLSSKVTSASKNATADVYLSINAFPPGSNYKVIALPPCCVTVSKENSENVVTISHDTSKLPSQSTISLMFIK